MTRRRPEPAAAGTARWADVRALIDGAGLPGARRASARTPCSPRSPRAEARVHGVEPEEVHFHEVGALDAIGDVCGIALALESLAIDELVLLAAAGAARAGRRGARAAAAARARDARAAARRPAPRRRRSTSSS